MLDTVAQYGIQFTTITAGSMGLAEWATLPIGTAGKNRKMFCCLIYATALGVAGLFAGLVAMPGEAVWERLLGVGVSSAVSTGVAHGIVRAKKAILG